MCLCVCYRDGREQGLNQHRVQMLRVLAGLDPGERCRGHAGEVRLLGCSGRNREVKGRDGLLPTVSHTSLAAVCRSGSCTLPWWWPREEAGTSAASAAGGWGEWGSVHLQVRCQEGGEQGL